MQVKKKMSWLILLIGLLPFIWLFVTIDDWQRDFTTNTAETAVDHADQRLRPLESRLSPEETAAKVVAWVQQASHWEVVEPSGETAAATSEGKVVLHLVRTTPLMRFKDDIYVTIVPVSTERTSDAQSVINARSASRVGKGDLGQNPRNLRELLAGIAKLL